MTSPQILDFWGTLPPLVSSNLLVNVSFLGIFCTPLPPPLGRRRLWMVPKQNSKLRIHSKRDRNQLRLTVCSAEAQTQTQTTLFTFMKRAKIQTAMCVLAFYILLNLPEFLSDPSVFLAVLINTDASEKRVIPLSK